MPAYECRAPALYLNDDHLLFKKATRQGYREFMTQATILIIEGDATLASAWQDLLSRQGYAVPEPIPTGAEGVRAVAQAKPDLILIDIDLAGDLNGLQTFAEILKAQEIPAVFVSSPSQEHLIQEIHSIAPYGYLVKPFSERELTATLGMALSKHRLDQQVRTCETRYRGLIGLVSDVIFLMDGSGRVLEVNPAGCALLGRNREEILGVRAADFLNPEGAKIVAAGLAAGDPAVRIETWLVRPDGGVLTVDVSIQRLEDGSLQAIVRDISERKRLERESNQATNLFKLFVQNVPVGIAMFDREMRYIAASRHYLRMNHLPEQNLTGRSHYEVFPEISERWKEIHQRCLNGAIESSAEDLFQRADGSQDWVRWRIEPWYETPGKIGGIVLFSEIITDQKKMLQDLQESEQKFRDLFEKHAAVKLLIDPADGSIVDANHAAEKFYGWSVEQLKQMRIQDINALGPELTKAEMEKAKNLERIYFEFVHFLADGSQRDVEVYSSSVEIKGKILLHSIVHDITSQKKAAETLRVSEERFRILTGLLPVGVYLTDAGGKVLFANGQWLENTGLSLEDAQQRGALASVHPEECDAVIAAWESLVASKGKQGIEYRILKPDGSILWVYAMATAQYDESGQLLGYLGVNIDITERKKADLLLNQQLDELRRWNEITLGRETRVLELKKEINQLLAQMGAAPRYTSAEAGR